jgi:SAM-dependent methyltransferase
VASAARNLANASHAHVVQGDLDHPPFRRDLFDVVLCLGVLHHVPDARATFRQLDRLVRPSGRLLTWVYGPRQGLTRIVSGALRGATAEMSPEQLHRFSQVLAGGVRVFSHTPHRFLQRTPVLGPVVTHLPLHDHSRWPFHVVVADVYDRLRIPVTGYFTGEEIEGWYATAGYADIDVRRRVRNTESFTGSGVRR